MGNSLNECSGGGVWKFHSIVEGEFCLNTTIRLNIIVSQIININIAILTVEIIDPIDEIEFHVINVSG